MFEIANKKFESIISLLKKYRHICKMIPLDEQLIKNLVTLQSIRYDQERVQSTNQFYSSVEDAVIRKEDLEERVLENKRLKNKVEIAFQILSDEELKLVKLFYLDEELMYHVAGEINCSLRRCFKVRDEALKKLDSFLLNIDHKNNEIQSQSTAS